jgi:hypothetical protein
MKKRTAFKLRRIADRLYPNYLRSYQITEEINQPTWVDFRFRSTSGKTRRVFGYLVSVERPERANSCL